MEGLSEATAYHWRLRLVTRDPYFPRIHWLTFPYNCATETDFLTAGTPSAVLDHERPTEALRLASRPSPFALRTTMLYSVLSKGEVHLRIYDAQGRLVKTLVDEVQDSGEYAVAWNATDKRGTPLTSGVYFAKLQVMSRECTRRLALMP